MAALYLTVVLEKGQIVDGWLHKAGLFPPDNRWLSNGNLVILSFPSIAVSPKEGEADAGILR